MLIRHSSRSNFTSRWATVLGALLLMLVIGRPAAAATFTWTGNGGNNLWSTNANWAGNASPFFTPGTHTLVFPAGAAQTTMLNNAPPGYTVAALEFGAPYTVTGNDLTIRDGVTFSGAGTVTLNFQIVLATPQLVGVVTFDTSATLYMPNVVSGAVNAALRKEGTGTLQLAAGNVYQGLTIVAEGTLDIEHPFALGAATASTTVLDGATLRVSGDNDSIPEPLVLAGQGPAGNGSALFFTGDNNVVEDVTLNTTDAAIAVAANRTARIGGVISGSAALHKRGAGTLTLWGVGANVYTGLTTVHGGTLVLHKNNTVAVPNGLSIENGTVRLGASNAIVGTVAIGLFCTLDVNGQSDIIVALNGAGALQLGSGQLTLTGDTQNSTFRGPITGTGVLKKVGNATLTLSGVSASFTGQIENIGGAVEVNGVTGSDAEVQGTMRGQGTVAALTMINGTLVPGGPIFSTLHSDSVTLNASSSLRINSTGSTDDPYTQLRVTGAVTLGNAGLTVSDDKVLAQSEREVTIIRNDGTNAVGGTFLNLPEGSVVTGLFGHRYRLSYVGGSGNDVTLRPLPDYHLSEGATGAFFDTDLLIANPEELAAPIEVRFLKPGGETVTQTYTVPAASRMTIRVDDIPGLEATAVSTIVTSTSGQPIIVERTMRWNDTGYGAHTEKAVAGPSKTWYFAEGSQGFFFTYLLLANPNANANTATVEYLREGLPPVTRSYPLSPNSRTTVDTGEDAELVNQSFGITVTFDQPGVAERAMYFGLDPLWKAGHESAGVQALSNSWFLAEGATGPFFETFVLLANPGDAAAEATVTFLPESGVPVVRTKSIPARSRLTVNIEAEDPALANAAVATRVESTQPIVVERAQYWPDPAPQWYEAHNSFGMTEPWVVWGLAEGRVGGPEGYQTYILLANPGNTASTVEMIFLREGQPPVMKAFTVPPTSRFTVSTGPGSLVPELVNERFGALILSTEPIVVERAMYANAGGLTWSAGTNATATRLGLVQP